MSRPAKWLLAPAALVALLAADCRPDFAPYNRLTILRVLAIETNPPTPATGETTTMTPLVFTPRRTVNGTTTTDPDPSLAYRWSWCPFPGSSRDGYPCLVDEATLNDALAAAGMPPVPPYDLGSGPTATFTNSLDPAILTALCTGTLPGQPIRVDCTGGFPIQITVVITTDTDSLTTVETVRLRFTPTFPVQPPIYGLDVPNSIPLLGDVTGGLPGAALALITDDLMTSTSLRRDVNDLRAAVDVDVQSETYQGLDDDKNPAQLRERLFLTWFVETGQTERSRTTFISGSETFDIGVNTWTPEPEKAYRFGDARIFLVLHDSRNGVSWKTGIVTLQPDPTP